ncbi:MAG: type I-E CRISPR-associated protein Cse2/CasB [Gammaproteobacteria bacterium]|nr:type I-E CRISPR-associated protein Cse2/CasB [Gammaproteobacteria bacterium]
MVEESRQLTAQEVARDWWADLTSKGTGPGRAALARIRRAHTLVEVVQEPAALRLLARLRPFRLNVDRVAVLAGVLAWVGESEDVPLAKAVGPGGLDADKPAILSKGRFQRVLQSNQADLMDQMRRVVRMNKGKASVEHLARAILFWGDRIKKEWIFDYYGVEQREP